MIELSSQLKAMRTELQAIIKTLAILANRNTPAKIGEWLRQDQVLKIMGISTRTFSRLTSSGRLPTSKIGGLIYIRTDDVDLLLNENYPMDNLTIKKK